METRELLPSTRTFLNEIEAAGVKPTVDEIVWLQSCCQQLHDASDVDYRHLLGMPFFVSSDGSLKLYGLSIAAMAWYAEIGEFMFPSKHKLSQFALGFAMAYSRDESVWPRMYNYRDAKKLIDAWIKTLTVTPEELEIAIEEALGFKDKITLKTMGKHIQPDEGKSVSWADYVAAVGYIMGPDFSQWVWKHSADTLGLILRRHAKLESGGKTKDGWDPVVIASARIQEVVASIIAKHKAEVPANG